MSAGARGGRHARWLVVWAGLLGSVAAHGSAEERPSAPAREVVDAKDAPDAPSFELLHRFPATTAPDERPITVVVAWATWCGACHAAFPELTRIQSSHKGQVTVLALTDEAPVRVRRFFDARRKEMGFTVGVTDPDSLRRFLFGGFGGRGLPSAYVVVDGKVRWGGSPSGLQDALRVVLGERATGEP